jgi:hypothetical protein
VSTAEQLFIAAVSLFLWVVSTQAIAAIRGKRVPLRSWTGPGVIARWPGRRFQMVQFLALAAVSQAAMVGALFAGHDAAQSVVYGLELVAAAAWLFILLRYVRTHDSEKCSTSN